MRHLRIPSRRRDESAGSVRFDDDVATSATEGELVSEPGLHIVEDDVDAELALDESPIKRTQLWRDIYDAGLWTALRSAIADVIGGDTIEGARETLAEVDALNGEYREQIIATVKRSDEPLMWGRLFTYTRGLGTTSPKQQRSTIDDVHDGPIEIFASSSITPTVAIPIGREWFEQNSRKQRQRWLRFVENLATGMDVRLRCSRVTRARMLGEHEEDLPASCVNEIRQRRNKAPRPLVNATEAIESLTPAHAHPALDVLATIGEEGAEQRTFAEMYDDVRLNDVSESAIRKRVGRLKELGLVEAPDVDGDPRVALTPAGAATLEMLRDDDSVSLSRGGSGVNPSPDKQEAALSGSSPGVNDPPKTSAGAVYSPRAHGEPPSGDAAAEGEAVAGDRRDADPSVDWLPQWRHHAAAAAAPPGEIAIVDEPVDRRDDPRSRDVSVSEDRREVVISVEGDRCMALTAARMAAALTDDRILNKVLTDRRLGGRLNELANGNLPVLRLARNLGYLPTDKATPHQYRDRLAKERQKLLEKTKHVRSQRGEEEDFFNYEMASEVLQDAHGLLGTVTHILDLLGFDLIREITLPEFSRNLNTGDTRSAFAKFVAKQTAISTRYGHYTMERVMFEDDPEKRDQMLGAPVIDRENPKGEMLGSWVFRGPKADYLDIEFSQLDEFLDEPVEDGRNFEKFLADVSVTQPDRDAIANAVARLSSMKRLEPTRRAVSVLHAFTRSVYAAAEALYALGAQDVGRDREIQLDELRFALSQLKPAQLLDRHPASVGKILHALLSAPSRLSTSELADRADVSKQTLRDQRDLLEALGLLVVEETGAGKRNWWRLAIPFREERGEDAPLPPYLGGEDVAGGWQIHDVVVDALGKIGVNVVGDHWELWERIVDGEVSVDVVEERWPELDGWTEILARLLGDRGDRAPSAPRSITVSIGEQPDAMQASLTVPGLAADGGGG